MWYSTVSMLFKTQKIMPRSERVDRADIAPKKKHTHKHKTISCVRADIRQCCTTPRRGKRERAIKEKKCHKRLATTADYRCGNYAYHTIPYHTIPYHTIPYHTTPYRDIRGRCTTEGWWKRRNQQNKRRTPTADSPSPSSAPSERETRGRRPAR